MKQHIFRPSGHLISAVWQEAILHLLHSLVSAMHPYIREVTKDSLKHSIYSVRNPFQIPAEADLSVSYPVIQGDSVLSILFGGLYLSMFHAMT